MKTIYGILLVGVSAIALGGCSTGGGGTAALLGTALLGSGTYVGGQPTLVSPVAEDVKTTASIEQDTNGTPDNLLDDKLTVTVANGVEVAGPRTYVVDTGEASGLGTGGLYGNPATTTWAVGIPEGGNPNGGDNSILVVTEQLDSGAGFVGATNLTSGDGNIAAVFTGTAPSGTMPADPVTYSGSAAAVQQLAGTAQQFMAGTTEVNADFTNGTVDGTFAFTKDDANGDLATPVTIGFDGTMSTDKATYESASVTYAAGAADPAAATGQVIGGFYGADYYETAGAIDVQDADTGAKVTGSFVGTDVK